MGEEGAVGDSVFVLVSGRLKVFTPGPHGREFIYTVMQPGELFGDLVLDGGRRSASVAAIEDCICLELERCDFAGFLGLHPHVAEYLILTLMRRIRRITAQMQEQLHSSVYERTVKALRAEAIKDGGRRYLPAWLTQKEIAARAGATREMVGKILRDLQRGGFLVRDERRRMVIRKEFPKRW